MAIQTDVAEFDGSQDYVDITWPEAFSSYRLYAAVYTTGIPPRISLVNATSTGVRVVPSARFTGTVYVEIFDVPPQAPIFFSIDPTEGAAGSSATISGQFFTDVTSVRFGTEEADFTVVDAQTIDVTVPEDLEFGITYEVFVTTAGGTSGGLFFTVLPPVDFDLFTFRRTISQPADGLDFRV